MSQRDGKPMVIYACGKGGCHAVEVRDDWEQAFREAAMAAGASEDDVRRMVEVARREAKRLGREP